MNYKISEVAKKTNLSIYTIRYYDKEGLLPFLHRTKTGNRVFNDHDIEWIELISCLKKTGLQIKDIRIFIECLTNNEPSIEKGLQILTLHKKNVQQQIEDTKVHLRSIEYKIKHLPQMYKNKLSESSL
ncbi:MerR family transcriptional regulator [Priestia megaterium]|uniref:MerR family transcriptional regulator n=1 Tax=Priestia megaterium TaxID=1404 RepID=UPI00277EB346|nr:DNA-binding transcriptional MerR regulator [Bacillus sp. 1751]